MSNDSSFFKDSGATSEISTNLAQRAIDAECPVDVIDRSAIWVGVTLEFRGGESEGIRKLVHSGRHNEPAAVGVLEGREQLNHRAHLEGSRFAAPALVADAEVARTDGCICTHRPFWKSGATAHVVDAKAACAFGCGRARRPIRKSGAAAAYVVDAKAASAFRCGRARRPIRMTGAAAQVSLFDLCRVRGSGSLLLTQECKRAKGDMRTDKLMQKPPVQSDAVVHDHPSERPELLHM